MHFTSRFIPAAPLKKLKAGKYIFLKFYFNRKERTAQAQYALIR